MSPELTHQRTEYGGFIVSDTLLGNKNRALDIPIPWLRYPLRRYFAEKVKQWTENY